MDTIQARQLIELEKLQAEHKELKAENKRLKKRLLDLNAASIRKEG